MLDSCFKQIYRKNFRINMYLKGLQRANLCTGRDQINLAYVKDHFLCYDE